MGVTCTPMAALQPWAPSRQPALTLTLQPWVPLRQPDPRACAPHMCPMAGWLQAARWLWIGMLWLQPPHICAQGQAVAIQEGLVDIHVYTASHVQGQAVAIQEALVAMLAELQRRNREACTLVCPCSCYARVHALCVRAHAPVGTRLRMHGVLPHPAGDTARERSRSAHAYVCVSVCVRVRDDGPRGTLTLTLTPRTTA